MISKQTLPLARTADLVVQEVDTEVLVYDEKSHEAHCLNPTSALVWRHCDGRTTASEMAAILHRTLGTPLDIDVVEVALEQLAKADLVHELTVPFRSAAAVTRRRMLGRLSAAGVAMALAPLVTTVLTQTAKAQASKAPPPPPQKKEPPPQ